MSLCGGLLLAQAGCEDPSFWDPNPQGKSQPSQNVLKAVCVYHQIPWISFGGDANPDGFKLILYLVSRETGKGILTDGLLQIRMYRKDQAADGTPVKVEVCAWTQDLANVPHTKQEYPVGWAYVPMLYWGDTDILGREVEIKLWYEDSSGRRVYAQPKTLQVPKRK